MSAQVGQQGVDELKRDNNFAGQQQVVDRNQSQQHPNPANQQFFPDNLQVALPEVANIWDKPVVILKPW